jgi:hypothetical protein
MTYGGHAASTDLRVEALRVGALRVSARKTVNVKRATTTITTSNISSTAMFQPVCLSPDLFCNEIL